MVGNSEKLNGQELNSFLAATYFAELLQSRSAVVANRYVGRMEKREKSPFPGSARSD